jgi:hypothetical protein
LEIHKKVDIKEHTLLLSFAGKWIELEDIILTELSQAQKTKNCMSSLIDLCGL